jgi:dihydroorotase
MRIATDKILIKNGFVYDPLTKEKGVRDIAVAGASVVSSRGFDPTLIIDAEGCQVIPGLIDFHLHCFTATSDTAVDADPFCLPNGVTACIDAGTAGTAGFESCYRNTVCPSSVTIKALLNIAPEGLTTGNHPENQDPKGWNRAAIRALVDKYPQTIVGFKVRMSAGVLDPFHLTLEPLVEALSLGEELHLPVVVHVNDPNVDTAEIAALLRSGDVFCHVYAGEKENILDGNNKIKPEIRKARERGVIFDACNGRRNFLFSVANPAVNQGFYPDVVSSDVNVSCSYVHPVVSLPRLLSKYLALGMDFYDVIDTATIAPAQWLGDKNLASLQEGTAADIALFKIVEKKVRFFDYTNAAIEGNQVLVPQLTIKNGIIAYSQSEIGRAHV